MATRVSVITAVYNRAGTVGQAIESVQAQTWPQVEHIVIDGGSTDGTLEVIGRHKVRIAKLVSEPDNGIYDALNKGLALATGDVVGFLHSDDFFAGNEALGHMAAVFSDPAVDVAFGDLDQVAKDDVSRVIRKWRCGPYSRQRLASGWMPPHPTFYVRRSLLQELGGFDLGLPQAADYDFMMRYLIRSGARSRYVPQVIVKMRTGGTSTRSLAALLQNARESITAIRKNKVGGVGTLLLNRLRKLRQFL